MFQKCKSGIRNQYPVSFLTIIGFILVPGFVFHQHVRHLMILKCLRYLSAYNEYCEVNME